MSIRDERVVLNGSTLRLFFRSPASFYVAELGSRDRPKAKTAPTLHMHGEYVVSVDLADLATDDRYEVVLRSADEARSFGQVLASRTRTHPDALGLGRKVEGSPLIIATSLFRGKTETLFATVYLNPVGRELRIRLSAKDDIDAFLASLGRAEHAELQRSKPDRRVRFSVITAAYNVDRYLEEFLESLTGQTLDFRSHIELVLIDDGSTDRSSKIIKRWQRKFPTNIRVTRRANGGLASARNVGLAEAKNDWITFIDPDDFVSKDYFESVADTLKRYADQSVALVSCNVVHSIESTGATSNRHPLRYRFAEGEKVAPIDKLGINFQATVCGAFWRKDIVVANDLAFDVRVRPAGEDVHFSGRYLVRAAGMLAVFQPAATYYHRRRADDSSITQTGWKQPRHYDDELRFGYLDLLEDATRRLGHVPEHIQNLVLYCLSWDFLRAVDRPIDLDFLDSDLKRTFTNLLRRILSFIDDKVIGAFDVTLTPLYRIGILSAFKGVAVPVEVAEVTDFDARRGLVRLVYWTTEQGLTEEFQIDEQRVAPAFSKAREVRVFELLFVVEHIRWLPVGESGMLRVRVAGRELQVRLAGRTFSGGMPLSEFRRAFTPRPRADAVLPRIAQDVRRAALSGEVAARFRDAWLFIDRDAQADDSAEFLYRYVRQNAPTINAFFIVKRGSPDWERLAAEGFRLIGFDEPDHAVALLNATHLISSQADHYVTGYLGREEFGDLLKYRFIFLQHGVTQGDFSSWFNRRRPDLVTAITHPEYEAFVRDGSAYSLTRKEVVLTGSPRHDMLLSGPIRDARILMIMPTWRSSLSGLALGAGNARSPHPRFYDSAFAERWKSLLHSRRLGEILGQAHCRAVFLPHPNMIQYLPFFEVPANIEVRTFGQAEPLQGIFRELSLFVTDYSSKAFDIAYLQKPVVYYQFDPDVYYGGGHTGRPGYFDFRRDGFGPVCGTEELLLGEIERTLGLEGIADVEYRERSERTFAFRDGKSCERVVQAILDLDRPINVRRNVEFNLPLEAAPAIHQT